MATQHVPAPTALDELDKAYARLARHRNIATALLAGVILAVIAGGLTVAEDANSGTLLNGLAHFLDYPADILADTYAKGWAWFALLWEYLPALVETVNIAILATLIGFVLGAALSFVASRNLVRQPAVVWVMRRLMDISRAFPELVLALLIVLITGPEAIAAVIAVGFHSIGALAKLFSEVNENVDMRPVEGVRASGGNWSQQVRFGVLPTVLPNFLSYGLLRLEINVRQSAIMGFVGAGGLGQALKTNIDWKQGADVSAIMLLLVGAIIAIDYASSWARHRLVGAAGTI